MTANIIMFFYYLKLPDGILSVWDSIPYLEKGIIILGT